MKRLSEMVADVENKLNQMRRYDMVNGIAKKDQHIDTLRKVIRMLY